MVAAKTTAPPKDTDKPAEKKAAPPGPDFTLKLLDTVTELPAEPARTRSVGYTDINTNLLALQEHPNVWAEVAHYAAKPGSDAHPGGAKKVVGKFLNGDAKAPESHDPAFYYDLEWRSASYDGSGRKGTVVLARYTNEQ